MSAPELSVIIPSVNGYADLRHCLVALSMQDDAVIEAIVVDRLGDDLRSSVKSEFPAVTVIPAEADATIPAMRATGHMAASAPAVAVIEDHVIVPENWARRMLDALAEGHDVVGGSIENVATAKLVDWAAFLCEYSASLPPLPSGPAAGLPGNNVVYRRSVLEKYRGIISQGHWENHLHDAMRADGIQLIMRPDIVVGHKMHYTFWLYLSQRFLYSRSYAGARVRGASARRRLGYGIAAMALPPLLFYRTVSRIVAKRRHGAELVKSLPLLSIFVLSWAAGEVVGYLFGPGNSLSKVR